MSDYFVFRDRTAFIKNINRRESKTSNAEVIRYNFVFETVEDLVVFLSMKPDEGILLGYEFTNSRKFMEDYFKKAHRIYTDRDSEFIDQINNSELPSLLEQLSKD